MLDYILAALRDKIVTKIEVEEATGIDKSTLYRWQEGQSIPTYHKVESIYRYIRKQRESQGIKPRYHIDLKSYRREQGVTQAEIEKETGIAKSRISRYETGKEFSEKLTEIFMNKLKGIEPYVSVNYTGITAQEVQDKVVNRLYELTPQKMALLQGYLGRLLEDDVDMKQLEGSDQVMLKTTDLLRIKCTEATVEVDTDSYAPRICKGDKLHIELYNDSQKLPDSTLVLMIFQDDAGEYKLTIGELYERINRVDPSMRYAHIEYRDEHKASLWIEWQFIIHLYKVKSHVRQIG